VSAEQRLGSSHENVLNAVNTAFPQVRRETFTLRNFAAMSVKCRNRVDLSQEEEKSETGILAGEHGRWTGDKQERCGLVRGFVCVKGIIASDLQGLMSMYNPNNCAPAYKKEIGERRSSKNLSWLEMKGPKERKSGEEKNVLRCPLYTPVDEPRLP
jgi:hypothetical protein